MATGVEYIVSLFYQKVLSVSFWNYEGQLGNLQGRVCVPFALAWGALLLPMVYWLQPMAAQWVSGIPQWVSWAVFAALSSDLLVSAVLLRHTGDTHSLRWYRLRSAGR